MPAIALIGPDGAGKTTLARMLEGSGLLPFKYVYMGINITSSNLALPTSRLVERLKPRLRRGGERARRPGASGGERKRRGALHAAWATARLANRVAEECFRQLVSWSYQLRGYTVLYDRHFVFDLGAGHAAGRDEPLDKRLNRWFLTRVYPRPDLVIFLDAPGEVLFARKGESSAAALEERRQIFLRMGAEVKGFVRVDATRPLGVVYAEVVEHILASCSARRLPRSGRSCPSEGKR